MNAHSAVCPMRPHLQPRRRRRTLRVHTVCGVLRASILRIARQVFLRIAYCAAELLQYPAIRPRTSARHTLVLFWPVLYRLLTHHDSALIAVCFFLVFFFAADPR
ncbi:hypothetical protein V8C34DRAFT_146697 [Trichoderma compactum]